MIAEVAEKMVFSSVIFLFLFLPIVLGCHYLLPGREAKKSLARRSQSAVLCLQALSYAGVLALLLVDILHLSAASYVPFIYFQF